MSAFFLLVLELLHTGTLRTFLMKQHVLSKDTKIQRGNMAAGNGQ